MNDTLTADVTRCLESSLPIDQKVILKDLDACMVLTAPLLKARTAAYRKYLEEHERLRNPKDIKLYTDFDRQSMLNAAVADRQEEYELLHGLEKLLNTRIEILKGLLDVSKS